jgi:hypothetical protein
MSDEKMLIFYRVIEHEDNEASRHGLEAASFDLQDPDDVLLLAEMCAEDYFRRHDGWEATWPLTFALYETAQGPEFAQFEIQCEVTPTFVATRTPNGQ